MIVFNSCIRERFKKKYDQTQLSVANGAVGTITDESGGSCVSITDESADPRDFM